MAKYRDEDVPDFESFFSNPFDLATSEFDIETARKENIHLNNLNEQLLKSQQQLKQI